MKLIPGLRLATNLCLFYLYGNMIGINFHYLRLLENEGYQPLRPLHILDIIIPEFVGQNLFLDLHAVAICYSQYHYYDDDSDPRAQSGPYPSKDK